MGPIIICDKSTIQALGREDLHAFRRYYSLSVPPILAIEILADLRKSTDPKKAECDVATIAKKIQPAFCSFQTDFRQLVKGELAGYRLAMDGRPVLSGGKRVQTPDGKQGATFDESPQAAALMRWQSERFSEAETILADLWRLSTQSIDLEAVQRSLRGEYSPRLQLKSLDQTAEFVATLISTAPAVTLLIWFLRDIGIIPDGDNLPERFVNNPKNLSLTVLAPYTAHCVRVSLIFHFALAFGLISTRPTNRVDLEYLFYAPFAHVFSSGDKFHTEMAPLVLGRAAFAPRDELKDDLKGLAVWWNGLSPDEQKKELTGLCPPENENSITHRLWRRFMRPDFRKLSRELSPLSEHVSAKMLAGFRAMKDSARVVGDAARLPSDDLDFMTLEHKIRPSDPCICGSGIRFKDCCGTAICGPKMESS